MRLWVGTEEWFRCLGLPDAQHVEKLPWVEPLFSHVAWQRVAGLACIMLYEELACQTMIASEYHESFEYLDAFGSGIHICSVLPTAPHVSTTQECLGCIGLTGIYWHHLASWYSLWPRTGTLGVCCWWMWSWVFWQVGHCRLYSITMSHVCLFSISIEYQYLSISFHIYHYLSISIHSVEPRHLEVSVVLIQSDTCRCI